MAPPSTKPKLSEISAEKLAYETVQKFADHLSMQFRALDSRIAYIKNLPKNSESPLYSEILVLTRYAQGTGATTCPVQEHIRSLLPLWSSALGRCDVMADLLMESPSTELGLVMAAACAREDICNGRAVSIPGLAILASVSPRLVYQLVSDGDLRAKSGHVSARDALRWLALRRVTGFTTKAAHQ